MISIEIMGEIYAKRSVRVGRVITKDPDKQIKESISLLILCTQPRPKVPFKKGVRMDMAIFFPIPKSYVKLRKEGDYAYEKRMDCDNIRKLYQDILNFGVLKGKYFLDDKQICAELTTKRWTFGESRILINLEELK